MYNMNLQVFKSIMLSLVSSAFLLSLTGCENLNNPGGGIGTRATSRAKEIPLDVAIMMPISGNNSELYKELSLMAKLGISDSAQTQVRVTTYDTSNKAVLDDSIRAILGKNPNPNQEQAGIIPRPARKSDIVIGPIFSGATTSVSDALTGHKIPILTLSNNPVLAREDVFVFGHAPMKQTEKLVNDLLSDQHSNFIILLPSGRHSQSVTNILKEMIGARGGVVSRVEFYNNSEDDISRAIRLISDDVDNLNEVDLNLKKPVILIGDDEVNLSKIYAYAAGYRLDKKALIAGDARINVKSSDKLDIVYTGSLDDKATLIKAKAANLGIKHVGFLHEVAYDVGYIAGISAGSKYSYKNFLANMAILNAPGDNSAINYKGLSGKINFIDSISQRVYDLIYKRGRGR